MSTNNQQPSNPFPGLRPFRSDEHHLFFGREEQTSALLQLLRKNRFLAVVGTSGSGKSSLVRAGMIAELYGGTMTHAGSAWEVMILRPGGSPIENLARAMVEADLYDAEDPSTLPRLKATLGRSRFGLVEAMKQSDVFEPGTNLLVVVDQFEELFRFRQQGTDSEEAATAFVNLLLTASEQAECPIYVTITMRSDYLGDCSEIPGLAEAVNEGEYLIPRLLRDQKRDAIEKPTGVGGAKISPLLIQRLLNDVGDDPDQLPVLQHALMRMWEVWSAGDDHDRPIEVSDFEATGGLASALSNHADEIYDSLPDDEHRAACEKVFKSLTEKGDDNRGIRRPSRLAALQAIAGSDRETLTTVLDAFRKSGVTFLMPGRDTELTDRTVLDLSHESLMRGWQRLRTWVEDEAQSARIFRRAIDTARLWSNGKAGLFRDPDLQIAISWREAEEPTSEWAEQYGGDFQTAIDFLNTSNTDAEAELQQKEAARQRELEQAQRLAEAEKKRATDQARSAVRLRWMVRGLGLVAMVAVMATVFAWLARQEARSNADIASQKALEAESQRSVAVAAQEKTAIALTKAAAAEEVAKLAEQRSREFRYATDMQLAAILLADETSSATQILAPLNDYDPEKNSELEGRTDLRGFEWHYLKRMIEEKATTISGFEKNVVAAVLSPNGELVTLDENMRLQRWDPKTKKETHPALDLKQGRNVTSHALSSDGQRVAIGIGDRVHLVDATSGEESARTISALTKGGLLFSPDGSMLITVDTEVAWWDATTCMPIARQEFNLQAIGATYKYASVSADGLTVAVGGQGNYRFKFSVFKMDPKLHNITLLLDKAGGNSTKRIVRISPDGQAVAVSQVSSGSVSLYDSSTGELITNNTSAHSSTISAIAFNPSGTQLLTAAMDGSVKVWEDYRKLQSTSKSPLVGHSGKVDLVVFGPGGSLAISADKDQTLRLWDLEHNKSSLHQKFPATRANRARYSPDGTLMALSLGNQVQIRDGVTGQVIAQLPKRDDAYSSNSVAFSPDNRLLAAGFGGPNNVSFIELWDIDRRKRIAVLPGTTDIPGFTTGFYKGTVSGLDFSPDGKLLVAGFGSMILLSEGDRGSHPLLVYDVETQRVIRRLEGPQNSSLSISFSRDGSRLANACFDGTARIWDTATWQVIHVLQNPDQTGRRVQSVAYSPDDKQLAMASSSGNVIIWNTETGEQLRTLSGHSSEVWSLAFSPNGRTLASGSTDGTVRLWNTATWRELLQFKPGEGFDPRSLIFSPDGNRLLASSRNGGAVVWSVQTDSDITSPTKEQLNKWLELGLDFQNRIRMQSEHLQLHESLAQQLPENAQVTAALAATRANWYASNEQWQQAAEQFDLLKTIETGPEANGSQSHTKWLRTPGLFRLATALLHQNRPTEAASLLNSIKIRRDEDGNVKRATGFGFTFESNEFSRTLGHVYLGSPAWQAGLREGHVLLKLNDVELTKETLSDYMKLANVTLTIQNPKQDQPYTANLAKTSYIQDDFYAGLIETLQVALDHKLSESTNDPGLLELRVEFASQFTNNKQKVSDYTAAIEKLLELPADDQIAETLARLYHRRGSAYVGLNQWQSALDDFAKGILDKTSDEELLASQARAQAEMLLDSIWKVLTPLEMKSKGGATLTLQDDGSILASGTNPDQDLYTLLARPDLTRITAILLEAIPDPSFPGNGPGRSIQGVGNFQLNELKVISTEGAVTLSNAVATFQEPNPDGDEAKHAIDGKLDARRGWSIHRKQGQPHTLRASLDLDRAVDDDLKIELHTSTGKWPKNNLGRFRLSVTDNPNPKQNSSALLFARKTNAPWQLLAAAYQANNDQQAIDQLVERRPQAAGDIGDLFIQGDDKDWQRAIDIYSNGFTPEALDVELLTKRAQAYEGLNDWQAATADWNLVAGEEFDGSKLLAAFASRLEKADQQVLARTQLERAREMLEAILQNDPDDAPAIDSLAAILLDLNEIKEEWTALKPVDGTTVTAQDDGSFLVNIDSDSLAQLELPEAVEAIRIESLDASSHSESGALQGQFVRIDLPGDSRIFERGEDEIKLINLAELQVFHGNENIALRKAASQSSTYSATSTADRGVDGNTDSITGENTDIVHTTTSDDEPWWEVDLGGVQTIDRIVVWNRVDWSNRMKHFRIRVLDSSRNVVFEQIIDEAPDPSHEISCQSLLAINSPEDTDEMRQWSLRVAKKAGLDPDSRIQLASTHQLYSLKKKDDIAAARKISVPTARLAAAYDIDGKTNVSANLFAKTLDAAKSSSKRNRVLTLLQSLPKSLSELIKRRPDDTDLQLALARSHVVEGQKKLTRKQPDAALTDFNQASDIFTRLLDQNPEPEWTVLQPTEMTSEGGATLTLRNDNSILVSGENPENDSYSLTIDVEPGIISTLMIEAIPDPSMPGSGVGRGGAGSVAVSEITLNLLREGVTNPIEIPFEEAVSDISNANKTIDKTDETFWGVNPDYAKPHKLALRLREPLHITEKTQLVIGLEFLNQTYKTHGLGCFRLSVTDQPIDVSRLQLLDLDGSDLALLDVAIGKALVQQEKFDEAATSFAQALNRVDSDEKRKSFIEQFQEHQAALIALLEHRPQDTTLQLVLAKSLAQSGLKALDEEREEALSQLAKAQKMFVSLAAEFPKTNWTLLQPTEMSSEGGEQFAVESDGSIIVSGPIPTRPVYTIQTRSDLPMITSLRIETIPDSRLPKGGAGRHPSSGTFVLGELKVAVTSDDSGGTPTSVEIAAVTASYQKDERSHPPNMIDNNLATAWGVWPQHDKPHTVIINFRKPVQLDSGELLLTLDSGTSREEHGLGRFRLSATSDPNAIEVAKLQKELKESGLTTDLQISLGNTHGKKGRVDEAAMAFSQALDLATDSLAREKILNEVSVHHGILNKLMEIRARDAVFHDALARYFQTNGDVNQTLAAAKTAQSLYEEQLALEPINAQLANAIADLMLEVDSIKRTTLIPVEIKSEGDTIFAIQNDGSILVSGDHVAGDAYTLSVSSEVDSFNSIRLEVLPDDTLPENGPGRDKSGNFHLESFQVFGPSDDGVGQIPIDISSVLASFEFAGDAVDIAGTIDDKLKKAWHVFGKVGQRHYADYQLAEPLRVESGKPFTIVLKHRDRRNAINLGRFRLSVSNENRTEISRQKLAASKITSPWLRLGVAYQLLGESDKAIAMFTQAVGLTGRDQARVAVAQEAAAFPNILTPLLEQFPDDNLLRVGQAKYLVDQHNKLGQFQEAVEILSTILKDYPDDINLLNQRAQLNMKLAQWQAADEDYIRIIEMETVESKRRLAERTRAECGLRLGRLQESADVFFQYMLLNPKYYLRVRDACLSLMLSNQPDIQKVAANRLYAEFNSTRNPDRAVGVIRVSILQPGLVTQRNSAKLLELAKVAGGDKTGPLTAAIHYRLGNLKQAEPLLAISDASIQFRALGAMLLYDQGKHNEARAFLKNGPEAWIQQERAKDPLSFIPVQQEWLDWSVRLPLWREAARKLIGPRIMELDKLLAGEPDNTPGLKERADLLTKAGLHEQALNDLEHLSTLKID